MSKWINAKIKAVKTFSDTIIQVSLVPDIYIPYQAGQYLQIKTSHYCNYFSIANAPLGSHDYELHIRHDINNPSSVELLQTIQTDGILQIQAPFGVCHVQRFSPSRDLIFIAGGTGFAPIKAIIEQLLFFQDTRIFSCYWGAKQINDLYCENLLKEWHGRVKNFQHLKCYAGIASQQLFNDVIQDHLAQQEKIQVILSGPFEMVFDYREKLCHYGLAKQYIYSDAFEFEK